MSIYTKYVKALCDENVLKIVHWDVSVECILYSVLWGDLLRDCERDTKEHRILR